MLAGYRCTQTERLTGCLTAQAQKSTHALTGCVHQAVAAGRQCRDQHSTPVLPSFHAASVVGLVSQGICLARGLPAIWLKLGVLEPTCARQTHNACKYRGVRKGAAKGMCYT
jgi:hypothetical protein